MTIIKIDPETDTYDGKHLVIHCGTGEVFACDTHEEALTLAEQHSLKGDA